eukprot:COSAG05_NODE_1387_length_5007_cov_322.307253_2_plen_122_part_00
MSRLKQANDQANKQANNLLLLLLPLLLLLLLLLLLHAQPSTMTHLNNVYHLAPNTVLIVGGGQPQLSQHWPGKSVGSSLINVSIWSPILPDTPEAMQQQRIGFGSFLDLIAGEDFQLLGAH